MAGSSSSVVFSCSAASSTFNTASTAAPETSEDEHSLEEDVEGARRGSQKRKSAGEVEGCPGMRRVKKNSRKDKFDAFLELRTQVLIARKELYLARIERYKSKCTKATSSMTEECSVNKCMDVLESTPGVSTKSYFKALESFLDGTWRRIFLMMPEDRRKYWLDSLAN